MEVRSTHGVPSQGNSITVSTEAVRLSLGNGEGVDSISGTSSPFQE